MAIIVEDGTGLSGAETYASVAEADAYHTPRGNEATWTDLDTEDKEKHLRSAADFMVYVFRKRWAGSRVYSAQALDWPRAGVVVDNFTVLSTIVPADVKRACIELALRAVDGPLLPDVEAGNNQIKREKVGPLDTEYFQANTEAAERFPVVNAIVELYFGAAASSGAMKVTRA